MKFTRRSSILVLVIMILFTGIFPWGFPQGKVEANSAGLNLHAPFSKDTNLNPNGISLTEAKPYETNQSTVSVSGTPVGIDPNTVSFRVVRVGTDQIMDEQPSPIVSGGDFTFQNVILFPGLNKIELYGNVGGSTTTMEERFVYFHNSPSIYNLEVIDATNIPVVNFSPPAYDPLTFPNSQSTFDRVLRVTNTPITIQGNAMNADEVSLEGEQAARFGDQFVVDTKNVGIVKGDYDVKFTAKNSSAMMQYPYNLAFSNGEPMVLDIQANLNTKNEKLNQLKTVTLDEQFEGATNDLSFSGYLYVDTNASFSDLRIKLQHISDEIIDQDSTIIDLATLNTFPQLTVNNKYTVYYLDSIKLDGGYDLYNNPGQYQLVFETYDGQNPAVKHTNSQIYRINYVNETLPYIKSVTLNGVSLEDNNLITKIGEELVVEVGGSTTSVTLQSTMLSTPYSPAGAPTVNGDRYTFKLDNVQPGNQLFTITASDGGPTPFTEEYFVEVILTPTVRLSGINNDQIFNTNAIPFITAEYINFTNTADRANTVITLNGIPETDLYDLAPNTVNEPSPNKYYKITNVDGTTCVANNCLENDKFGISINSTAVVEGRNELKFTFTNNLVTSEYTLVFYYLANDAPFTDMKPIPENEYKLGDLINTYTTTNQFADFEGTIANAEYLVIKKNGQVIAERQYNTGTGNWDTVVVSNPDGSVTIDPGLTANTWDINISNVNLITENTDGTFNFNATNNFTFEVFKFTKDTAPLSINSITITRSPADYDPIPLTKSFLEKGVINRNYLPFTIDTDGAISVTVNKLPMEEIPQPVVGSNRTRYHLDVPLKSGRNKLNIEVEYPGTTVKDTIEILSSTINQAGAAQKELFGKQTKFKMFNNDLELEFPKGTLIRQANPTDGFAQLYNDIPLFFGIALKSTGLVLEENSSNTAAINLMQARLRIPERYAPASHVYWVDAGQMENDLSVNGGTAPFSSSSGELINTRTDAKKLVPSAEGTLTIKYDPALRVAASHLLTVMYHDGVQWTNMGGVVDSKKGTITVPFRKFGYYTVMRFDQTFNDVIGHAWARDEIEILKARGWMRELSPNLFGTGTIASRGELATMLIKALDIPLDYEGNMSFADVPRFSADPNQLWDYRYIETAARVGIVRGGDNNLFRPADPISRQDTAIMIARAMNLKLSTNDKAKKKVDKKFTDAAQISIYAMPSIEAVDKKGIMTGKAGATPKTLRFDPKATLSRAELATITVRMLKDVKRLEK